MTITKNQLIEAVRNNDITLVKNHIHEFANINFAYKIGHYSLLELATLYKNQEIAQLLIENNANIQSFELMRVCLQTKQFAFLKQLLDKGFDIHQTSEKGENLLMCAASYGAIEYIKFFSEKGLDLLKTDSTKSTVLDYALTYPQASLEFIQTLLDEGIKCSVYTLSQAIKNQNLDVVKLIVNNCPESFVEEIVKEAQFFNYEVNLEVIEYILDNFNYDYYLQKYQSNSINIIKDIHSYDESEKLNIFNRLELLKKHNIFPNNICIRDMLNHYINATPQEFEPEARYQLISTLCEYFDANDYFPEIKEIKYLLNAPKLNPLLYKVYKDNPNRVHNIWQEFKSFDDSRSHPTLLNLIKLDILLSSREQGKFLQMSSYKLINQYLALKKDKDMESSLINVLLNKEISTHEKIDLINQCLSLGANINVKTPSYEQNLFFLTTEPKVAQHLIDLGLNYYELNSDGHNVYSSTYMNPEMLDFWQEKGLDINQYSEQSKTNITNQKIIDGQISHNMLVEYIKRGAKVEDEILKENFKSSFDELKSLQEKYLFEHILDEDKKSKNKLKI
jgi:ankyrin repeat protein